MSQRRPAWVPALWLAAALALAAVSPAASIDCSNTPAEPPFKEPPVIEATCGGQPCQPGQPGAINTTFRLEIKEQCVPGSTTPMKLRTYVYPDPQNPQNWIYGFPGPTLKLRKAFTSNPGDKGDTLAILLVNNLPPDSQACNSACPATNSDGTPFVCPDRSKLPAPPSEKCPADPLCCCWVNVNQRHPDCLHGDNTTNLHLHGTHISPQSPQDYVLLELHPAGNKGKALHAMSARSNLQVGEFQYRTDPFPYTQAEGSHWYHPHKHGSVSIQVANGMPGALIILGPFDKWLADWYATRGTKLTERVLVAQQIEEGSNLFGKGGAPKILINGLLNPKLTVQAGAVERWRVVNATMQKSSQLTITFPAGSEVMQIAQDGVQFARGTYAKQPLLTNGKFTLSPGNRADFLVRMPPTARKVRMTEAVRGTISARARQKIQLRDQEAKALAASNEAEAPILTLEVVEPPKGEAQPQAVPAGFPSEAEWPEMPWYLQNIQPNEIKGKQNLTFSMASVTTGPPTQGAAGDPSTMFFINDRQYDPACVNVTTSLGTADEWHVENSSSLAHPFHIHTNPFQLVELGAMINGQPVPSTKYDPPIWHDTIALPTPTSQDVDAGPIWNNDDAKVKCPGVCQKTKGVWNGNWTTTVPGQMSVCGCDYNGYVKLLHRYLDFTGEYVLHCHFLGHEDRGMMFGVQTVCKEEPTKFGKAKADGSPECVPGNLIPATQKCSVFAPPISTATPSGH